MDEVTWQQNTVLLTWIRCSWSSSAINASWSDFEPNANRFFRHSTVCLVCLADMHVRIIKSVHVQSVSLFQKLPAITGLGVECA